MAKTLEEYIKEAKKQTDPSRERDIDTIDSSADNAVASAENTYNQSVKDTNLAYANEYEKNAVQKLINEKQIAERNANLGLSDSGLNRTQQTAVQLGYANQKGSIDVAKRRTLDKLSSDLAAYITDINNQRETNKLTVNQSYDQQNNTIATEMYNADVSAAVLQSSGNTYSKGTNPLNVWTYTGTTDDNSNVVFRNSEGKTQSFKKGVNPYTGTVNVDIYKGTFKNGNGYQPNNIGGVPLEEVKIVDAVNTLGETLKVWTTDSGNTLYVWDALTNRYEDVTHKYQDMLDQIKESMKK